MAGLAKLLTRIRETPVEGAAGRASLQRVNCERFDMYCKRLSMPAEGGGAPWDWDVVDLSKVLPALLRSSHELSALYKAATDATPPSMDRPWSLVVAFDEFSPGNKLQVDNKRKTMVLSVSFLQLGQVALSLGRCWVTLATVRVSGGIDHVAGGWTTMLTGLLTDLLFGVNGLSTAGIPLRVDGRAMLLYARLTNVLADGDGLRQGYAWRGASGLKPCLKHYNCFKRVGVTLPPCRRQVCNDATNWLQPLHADRQ